MTLYIVQSLPVTCHSNSVTGEKQHPIRHLLAEWLNKAGKKVLKARRTDAIKSPFSNPGQ